MSIRANGSVPPRCQRWRRIRICLTCEMRVMRYRHLYALSRCVILPSSNVSGNSYASTGSLSARRSNFTRLLNSRCARVLPHLAATTSATAGACTRSTFPEFLSSYRVGRKFQCFMRQDYSQCASIKLIYVNRVALLVSTDKIPRFISSVASVYNSFDEARLSHVLLNREIVWFEIYRVAHNSNIRE